MVMVPIVGGYGYGGTVGGSGVNTTIGTISNFNFNWDIAAVEADRDGTEDLVEIMVEDLRECWVGESDDTDFETTARALIEQRGWMLSPNQT